MAKYLFVYHGGKHPGSPEEVKKAHDAWSAWFSSMGSAVIDGGNPVGKSSTVTAGGAVANHGGANPAFGYSLIEAPTLADAHAKAAGCPMLASGGSVEVAECIDM